MWVQFGRCMVFRAQQARKISMGFVIGEARVWRFRHAPEIMKSYGLARLIAKVRRIEEGRRLITLASFYAHCEALELEALQWASVPTAQQEMARKRHEEEEAREAAR